LIAATSYFNVVCRRAGEIRCEPGRGVKLTFTAVAWTTPLSIPKGIIRIERAELCIWNRSSFTEVVVADIWWDGSLFGRTTTWTGAVIIYFRIASSKSPNVLSWRLSVSNAYPINVVGINGISKIMIRVESMWISVLVSNDAATHLAILLLGTIIKNRVTTSR
jgi:hypothetical protein